jgi:transposase
MFLKVRHHNNKAYVSIVESVWEKGKCQHRNVASLGHLPPDVLKDLGAKFLKMAGVAGEKRSAVDLKEIKRVNWGASLVYRHLWDLFDLGSILQRSFRHTRTKFDAPQAIFNLVMDRLIEPSSKLQSYKRQDEYLGIQRVSLQHFYRCLDLLADHKDTIEEELFLMNKNLFNLTVDIVFYDVTTLYFESLKSDDLRNFGFSKDHKFGEVQVVVGLLVDQHGRPIGFDVFPGNTFEGSTLLTALEKLKNRFHIRQVIIVADRGINSKINLYAIREAGYHYIFGSRLRGMSKPIQTVALDLNSYSPIHTDENGTVTFKMKTMEFDNSVVLPPQTGEGKRAVVLKEKIIMSWSLKRAQKDAKDRLRLVDKAMDLIQVPARITSKRGAKRYLNTQIPNAITIDEQRILNDSQWDGIYGIQTSRLDMNEDDILTAYKQLWKIEESFRVLKSNLEIRPVFHWTPKRIKGHLVTCFIAFLLVRTLELTVREKSIDVSLVSIAEIIKNMEASLVASDQQHFYLRSNIPELGKNMLKALGLRVPKHVFTADSV